MSSAVRGSDMEIVRCRTARNRAPISVDKLHPAIVLMVHRPAFQKSVLQNPFKLHRGPIKIRAFPNAIPS
jgi:hypothetical protein